MGIDIKTVYAMMVFTFGAFLYDLATTPNFQSANYLILGFAFNTIDVLLYYLIGAVATTVAFIFIEKQ